uniref:Ras-associating domain-containing protein n=2 Tax=Bursaphelenchus xylophilus TaxID=6326 RepID=A0A1I7SAN7_BURXY
MADVSLTSQLANQYVCQTLTNTNNVINNIVLDIEKTLCETLPRSAAVIQDVLQKYKDPFKYSASIFNDTSTAQTRLPISIKTRKGTKEKREGTFATNVRGNIGAKNLEKACKAQNLVDESMVLVEVRRFERDFDEYCTVPPSDLPFIEIQQGVKYELVFEDMLDQKIELKTPNHGKNGMNGIPIHSNSPHPEIITHSTMKTHSNSPVNRSFPANQPLPQTSYSHSTQPTPSSKPPTSYPAAGGPERRRNHSHIGSVSKSAAAIREMEALKELPQFDIVEIIKADPKGRMVMDALRTEGIKKNGRQRVFFVQILGKYFSEVLKPQLCVANAATRRAFIDECFSQLSAVSNLLPNVEDYSNRMGNGFLDIYLKHQVTRERKKAQQKLNERQDVVGVNFDKIGIQNGSDLATLLMNLPQDSPSGSTGFDDDISIDPNSEEAAQLRKFNFLDDEVKFEMEPGF